MAAFNSNYVFPNEGLLYLLNSIPRGVVSPQANTYLGLFSNSWSAIQASGITFLTLNGSVGGSNVINEVNFSGYARQAIPSGSWNAGVTTSFTVSGTASGQSTTTNSGYLFTASGSATVNGIFVATTSVTGVVTSGTGATSTTPTVLWYAPFSDLGTVTLASGDTLTVTPTWQFAANAG